MNFKLQLTPRMVRSCTQICEIIGKYEGLSRPIPQPQLRKSNRIKTVQGSVAIEGNTLSLEQVTDLFSDKRVVGPAKDILEVKNAILAYENLARYRPFSTESFKSAHQLIMKGLLDEAGSWRKGQVGILKRSQVSHIAPPARQVPSLMNELFTTLKREHELHPILRAAWAHYEIEFVHPFADGNGRMGRLWQAVHLYQYHPIFEFVPVESMIQGKQSDYYDALERSDREGNAWPFVEFCTAMIFEALTEFMDQIKVEPLTAERRIEQARAHFMASEFSRLDYLKLFKTVSTATASRDLKQGVILKILIKVGEKAMTRYRFK